MIATSTKFKIALEFKKNTDNESGEDKTNGRAGDSNDSNGEEEEIV